MSLGVLDGKIRPHRIRLELRVAAYAVCIDDGRLLLARYVGHGPPHWTLPGGGVEHGEDPYDAVIREVAEETGYAVEVERLLGVQSARRMYPRPRLRSADHQTIRVFYAARIVGGALRNEVGGSTDLAEWVPLERLDEVAAQRSDLIDAGLVLNRDRPATGHLGPAQ